MESSGLQRLQGYYPHYHYHYLTPFSEHSSQIIMTLVIVFCACLLLGTLQEAGSEPPHDTKHQYPESRLAQNEWPKQLQHGVNEACEPPVLADRQLEGCSAMTSTRSKFMIERQNHQVAQARD